MSSLVTSSNATEVLETSVQPDYFDAIVCHLKRKSQGELVINYVQ